MSGPRKILLLVSEAHHSPAWHRAVDLARRSSSALHILSLAFDRRIEQTAALVAKDVQQMAKDQFLAERMKWLAHETAGLVSQGIDAACEVLWAPVAYEAVVARVLEWAPDLVVADLTRQRLIQRWRSVLPDVLKIARLCPAPLMLVHDAALPLPSRILVAVDPPPQAPDDMPALDDEIVRMATTLATVCGATVDLLHAFAFKPIMSAPYRGLSDTLKQIRADDIERFRELADRHGVPAVRRHVVEGEPSTEMLRCATRIGASLLVLGSHCRSGFDRLLLGSTAERLVNHSACDFVLVRPSDFVVRLATRLDLPSICRRYDVAWPAT